MYHRLAIQNAKRSTIDYLLYIFVMIILLSIICISNCIAFWGGMQANFQTASLPMLVVLIMVFLISYINNFMVRQRAKEFATYMLLGMKKTKLSFMFACEIVLIGSACFVVGTALGLFIYDVCFSYFGELPRNHFSLKIVGKSILYSFVYFCIVEFSCMLLMRRMVYKLQIIRLMSEKNRNQSLNERRKTFWFCLFAVNISLLWLMLWGILVLPHEIVFLFISVISIPVLCCIFAFYKWIYAMLSWARIKSSKYLYEGSRLYWIGEFTSGAKTSASMNAVFSICLLISAMSFIFGTLLLCEHIHLFSKTEQKWMAFLQISICIIFIVIYFSTLSVLQIIELKRQAKNIRVLHYMGKSLSALKRLIRGQILVKMLIPILMCLIILFSAVPVINFKLNYLISMPVQNILLKSTVTFIFCFSVLYFCYFYITYLISKRYIVGILFAFSEDSFW